jgi:glucokinase
MPSENPEVPILVFDLGGTWFRWGLYTPQQGLFGCQRVPAINYLAHPGLSASDLQRALVNFIAERARELRRSSGYELRAASISLGAPVNAHDGMVLGSGPLWGQTAKPFHLRAELRNALPDLECCILNDLAALLAPYMDDQGDYRKTMLVTVSSGIGSRLYDHRSQRIPYDRQHGIQGEIGHLVASFEIDGKLIERCCECGGVNHLNAFCSGRGIALTLRELPVLSSCYAAIVQDPPQAWRQSEDEYRLQAFKSQLEQGNPAADRLLGECVVPLARMVTAALALDPEIDRVVMTGGVIDGLGSSYRAAFERTLTDEGLYQITERDPHYLRRRIHWQSSVDFAGLHGAGVYWDRHVGFECAGSQGCTVS